MRGEQDLKSLHRGLQALRLINFHGGVTVAELARSFGLPRTTTERVLLSLAHDGYLTRGKDKVFRLTAKVRELASGYVDESWITATAAPRLIQVTEEIGWPLAIATPRGARMCVRFTTDPVTRLWLNPRHIGSSIPIHKASSGIVYYAFASDDHRSALDRTMAPAKINLRQVEAARHDGYALSPQASREQSLSVPIVAHGQVCATLLIIFMIKVLPRHEAVQKYGALLRSLAAEFGAAASNM
jgi:DNA-binding IclR family transcriptional regulator